MHPSTACRYASDWWGAHSVEQGAELASFQPQEGVRVYFDPAGHPFCLFAD